MFSSVEGCGVQADLARAVNDYDQATLHNDVRTLSSLVAEDYVLVNSGLPWWTGADATALGGYAGAPLQYRALSTFGDGIRLKRRQRAEEMAAKTTVKIIFPLVFFIFPCMFIVLLGPAGISIARGLSSATQ